MMRKSVARLALALAVCVGNAPELLAKPATYGGADLDAATAVLGRYRAPEISADTVNRLQDWIDAERQRRDTEEIVSRLRDLQTDWQETSARMDQKLEEVIRQATSDSVYRAWAGFFRFVATTADLAARITAYNAKRKSEDDAASDEAGAADNRLTPRPRPREGQVMVERWGKETIYRGEDGEWRKVGIEEVIQRQIYFAPKKGGNPGGARGGAGGAAGSVMQGMGDAATAYLQTLRKEGVEPYCSDGWQGCVLVKEGGDDSWQPPEVMREIRVGNLERPPTEAEKGLYRAVSGIVTPAEAGSLAADLMPVVGEAKSFLELVTGTDPVTGEDTSRMLALVGIIPVTGSKIKAGLKIAKISGKHLKAPAKLEKKWNFFVVLKGRDLSKLRKVEINQHTNVKVDVIGERTRELQNGYVHFTTKSGANGIVKEGGIVARKYPDGSKKVHMLKRTDDAELLTRSQVDTGKLIGKHTNDAKAAIVTKPGNRLIEKETLKSGAIEHRFYGDVGLEEGSLILMAK